MMLTYINKLFYSIVHNVHTLNMSEKDVFSIKMKWKELILLIIENDIVTKVFSEHNIKDDSSLSTYSNVNDAIVKDEYHDLFLQMTLFTVHCRDYLDGYGLKRVSFEFIDVWFEFFPVLASKLMFSFVYKPSYGDDRPYGSWRDIRELMKMTVNTSLLYFGAYMFANQLLDDALTVHLDKNEKTSLAAKWCFRESRKTDKDFYLHIIGFLNYSLDEMTMKAVCSVIGVHPSKFVKFTPRLYRKLLSNLNRYCNTVEISMCDRTFETIEFKNVPCKSIQKYSKAFDKQDGSHDKFRSFIKRHKNMKVKTLDYGTFFNKVRRIGEESDKLSTERMFVHKCFKQLVYECENNFNNLVVLDVHQARESLGVSIIMALVLCNNSSAPFRFNIYLTGTNHHMMNFTFCYDIVDCVHKILEYIHNDKAKTRYHRTIDYLYNSLDPFLKNESHLMKLSIFTDQIDTQYIKELSTKSDKPRLLFITTNKKELNIDDLASQNNVTVLNCPNLKVISNCLNSGKLPNVDKYIKSNSIKDLKKQLYGIRYKEVKVYVEGLLFIQHCKREHLIEQKVLA